LYISFLNFSSPSGSYVPRVKNNNNNNNNNNTEDKLYGAVIMP